MFKFLDVLEKPVTMIFAALNKVGIILFIPKLLNSTTITILISLAILALGFFKHKNKKDFLKMIITIVVTMGIAFILKKVIHRDRPFVAFNLENIVDEDLHNSFPSGHAAIVASLFFSIFWNIKNNFVVKLSLWFAIISCICRLILAVHFPTDILASIIIAYFVNYFVEFLLTGRKIFWPKNKRSA